MCAAITARRGAIPIRRRSCARSPITSCCAVRRWWRATTRRRCAWAPATSCCSHPAKRMCCDDSGEPARERRRSRSASLTVIRNGRKNAAANMLCGRFLLPSVPQQLLRDNLPRQLLVRGAGADADIGASDAGSRLARLIQLMREEALEQGPGSEAMMNHLSGALFGMTLRFASEALVPPRGLLALARRPRLQPASNAMFEQPGVAWSLPELARLCSMSRATFTRHFSAATGRSAADLLSEIRMTLAGRLLAQTARSVADIGQEVGYQSDAAFQRAFKKQVGVTPAQWRQQARSEH